MVEVFEISTKKGIREFIDFPRRLYAKEPNYIGELDITVKNKLYARSPFLKHSEIKLFVARDKKNNSMLGRIAAIYNNTHIQRHQDSSGFFGFFDCIDDTQVSNVLFNKVSHWLMSKGLNNMIGPTNLTTNDSCGLLVKGFEHPNQVNMPYNYSYYSDLLKENGFQKVIDLNAYHLVGTPQFDKYANVMKRAAQRLEKKGVKIRPMSSKSYHSDIKLLRVAYNKFNEKNWGFMPLNTEEFEHMAKELKSIMPYDLALIAEKLDEVIGYVIAVPDFNQVLKHIRNGKLLPFGIWKVLKYRKTIDSSRVMIIGIDDKYRGTGLDLILYRKITDALHHQKIFQTEAGYVMSTNGIMNSLILKIGGKPIKKYSLYQKKLANYEC